MALEVAVNGSGLALIGRHHVRCKGGVRAAAAIYSTNGRGTRKLDCTGTSVLSRLRGRHMFGPLERGRDSTFVQTGPASPDRLAFGRRTRPQRQFLVFINVAL